MSIVPQDTAVTIVNDGRYNVFPGIARFPNNRLIVVYCELTDHNATDGIIRYRTSLDDGATWSSAGTVYDPPSLSAADCEITLLANGTFLCSFWLWDDPDGFDVYVSIGTITGGSVSWGVPIAVGTHFDESNVHSSKPLQLANGSILLPIYGKDTGDTNFSAGVVKSTDNGATWGSFVKTATNPSSVIYTESNCVQLAGGRVVMIIRNDTLGGYSETHSDDNGATWSAVANVLDVTGAAGKPAICLLASGDIALLSRHQASLGRTMYTTSTDNGATWDTPANYGADLPFVYASMLLRSADNKIDAVISRENSQTDAYLTYQRFEEFKIMQATGASPNDEIASTTKAFTSDVVAGDLLVVTGTTWATAGSPASIAITDTRSTSYTVLSAPNRTNVRVFLAYGTAPTSGACTVTVDPSGSAYISFGILEAYGIAPLDVDGGMSTATSANPSTTITTVAATSLVVGVLDTPTGTTITPGSGYAQIFEQESSAANEPFSAEYQFFFTSGSKTVNWTEISNEWTIYRASFKPTALVAMPEDQVQIPTIDPNGGTFGAPQPVTLSCATVGATIYYTTNGTTPDSGDTEYTTPFMVSVSATVKAIAIKAAMDDSEIASALFTISLPVLMPQILV